MEIVYNTSYITVYVNLGVSSLLFSITAVVVHI